MAVTDPADTPRTKRWLIVAPLMLYVAVTLVLFGKGITQGGIFNPGSDPAAYIWFLYWWPFAVVNGLNPFISHFIWEPVGFSMMWSASIPALAFVFAPITWLFGADTTFNVLCLAAPPLNAWAAYALLRYLRCDRVASYVAGFLFGFSPYVIGQMLGHLSLYFVALIPLLVLLTLQRANHDIGRVRFVALTSLCAILQYGISHEVLATSALFGSVAFLVFYIPYRKTADLIGAAVDMFAAACVSLVVISPSLYYMYLGVSEMPSDIHPAQQFSSDLLNFLIPTPVVWLGHLQLQEIAARFTATYSEQGAYVGLPLLGATLLALHQNARKRWLLPLFLVLISTLLLSLGPVLQINGHVVGIKLPWKTLMKWPVIRHALPMRFGLYTSLLIAILIGIWLSSGSRSGASRALRYIFAVASIIFILPNREWFAFKNVEDPKVFARTSVPRLYGENATLVVLPYGAHGNSTLWQVRAGMDFRMAGGYIGGAPKHFASFPAISYFEGVALPPEPTRFLNELSAFCVMNGVTGILVTPGTAQPLVQALAALPWERSSDGESTLLKVPPAESMAFAAISGDYWGQAVDVVDFMGRKITVTNGIGARKLIISRLHTPLSVGDFDVTVTIGQVVKHYRLDTKEIVVPIPARAVVEVDAGRTWVPSQVIPGNNDLRQLSFGVRLEPA